MKKIIFLIISLSIIILLSSSLISCTNTKEFSKQNNSLNTYKILTLSGEGNLSANQCKERGLEGKYIMIESKYCSHCQNTKPDFLSAINELNMKSEIYDISNKDERTKMLSKGITIKATPTFIFNCNYFVGEKSKEEYLDLLSRQFFK